MAHEILLSVKKCKRKRYMAIKLDMKKAYDKLDWHFIKRCFNKLGFVDRWIN